MVKINPYLYRACSASCGAISTLPIDIIHTSVLTQRNVTLRVNELPLMLIMSNLFVIQNTVFSCTNCIRNISFRAILASLSISPFVIFIQAKNIIIDLGYHQSIKILYSGQLLERLYSILLFIIYTKVIYISLKYCSLFF